MKKRFAMSLVQMYPLNLLENEGVGLTYEQVVKWRLLSRNFFNFKGIKSILVPGLCQKYGLGLDYLMLAYYLKAKIIVVDERADALTRLSKLIKEINNLGFSFASNQIKLIRVNSLVNFKLKDRVDLAINSVVLQQYNLEQRKIFMANLLPKCQKAAFFVPNAANRSHALISGLATLSIEELRNSIKGLDKSRKSLFGYLDAPPFPPGIKRSSQQRNNLLSSVLGKNLISFLELWSVGERYVPQPILKKFAHLVYLLITPEINYG